METYRKKCHQQQTELRKLLTKSNQYDKAITLFMRQHAMLHTMAMSGTEPWSFEDQVLGDMSEEEVRRIPTRQEHSVAWCIWHIARIEDVAMNMLVAGSTQVMNQGNWLRQMNLKFRHTGNAMNQEEIEAISRSVNIIALRAYRLAVGRKTRQIVLDLEPGDFKLKVKTTRLNKVMEEGAVVEGARDIVDYWSRRDIAGLLLMPATRHNLVHLNEALKIKARRR